LDPILAGAIFIVGLAFGSFLNVCISRIPCELSIVRPGSYCPHCKARIRPPDNVPVISWLLLRGRCRACGWKIPWRYPAVELLIAAWSVACYAWFGFNRMGGKAWVFCFLTTGLIFMDAESGLLPREFTFLGIALGLALAWIVPVDSSGMVLLFRVFGHAVTTTAAELSLLDAVAASIFGAGFFYLAWAAYFLVRKREGLGFGDLAFAAMIGAFLGLKLTVLVVFLSPILGTMYALLLAAAGKAELVGAPALQGPPAGEKFLSREVPFGVFLGISALVACFLGGPLWNWYLGLFR